MKSHGTFRWWLLPGTLLEHSQWRVQWHRTNHTSQDWTAAVLGWSAVHRSQIPGSPGIRQGMVGSQEVAGLVGLQTLLYWVPDLWALGSLGTRRTCSHLNIFLNYLCFILTFLWNSYSLTPWFFADSRISRQRLAESFVGHGRDCGWEQSVVERRIRSLIHYWGGTSGWYHTYYFISFPMAIKGEYYVVQWSDRKLQGHFQDNYLDWE